MSDTPRTDALEITCNRDCANYLLDLSRKLERELDAALQRIKELQEDLITCEQSRDD